MDHKPYTHKKAWVFFVSIAALMALLFIAASVNFTVDFQDPGLERAVREKIKRPTGVIYKTELHLITELDASDKKITNLDGIEHLPKLVNLILDNNNVCDLSPLKKLFQLTRLSLRNNNLKSLEAISLHELSDLNITHLNLRDNNLEFIQPLENFNTLEYLNLHSNTQITSIAPIRKLTNLKTLIMANVPIHDQTDVLAGLTNLTRLNIRNTGVIQGDFLARLDNLEQYDLSYNVQPPMISHDGGFYKESFALTLSHPDPDVTIVYTLDGSEPDILNLNGTSYQFKNQYPQKPRDPFGEFLEHSYTSHLYRIPIKIYDRSGEPDKLTQISTTTCSRPTYFPKNPVRKGTVVRAKAYSAGLLESETITSSFFVVPDGNPYSLPVVSIAIQESFLFDYIKGIYSAGKRFDDWSPKWMSKEKYGQANFLERGAEWERRASIEYYENCQNGFKHEIGIRIHGGASRHARIKSFRLYARKQYDTPVIEYPVFDNQKSNIHKRLILSSGASDWWKVHFRDAMTQALLKDISSVTYPQYRPVVLFINGEYWGIYSFRDRLDRFFLRYQFGVDENKIDLLANVNEIIEGSNKKFLQLRDIIRWGDINNKELYRNIVEQIDIENYIDYHIAQLYYMNVDQPGKNVRFWRTRYIDPANRYADGKWRWLLFDTDMSFSRDDFASFDRDPFLYNTSLNHINSNKVNKKSDNPKWAPNKAEATMLLRQMLKNEMFRNTFINRFSDLLNTVFTPEFVTNRIIPHKAELEPYMEEHIQRWLAPKSMAYWEQMISNMNEFARERPFFVRKYLEEFFDVGAQYKITLKISGNKHGTIQINTININLTTPGVPEKPYPWTGIYFSGVPVEVEAIPSPGYEFEGWKELRTNKPVVKIDPKRDFTLTALFRPIGSADLIEKQQATK